MAKTIPEAVREICLSFPEAEEFLSHGAPNFRVRGKTFASFAVNHHGDGRVALWLNSPAGAQAQHTAHEPEYFFVPPYVGPRGWLGVNLDQGLSWQRIAALVRDAYAKTAPAALVARTGPTIRIAPPAAKLAADERDPLSSARALRVIEPLRQYCLTLPEASEHRLFGAPAWRAGKKTFAIAYLLAERLTFGFWVGVDQQGLYTSDPRFSIPAYMGHNGWIAMDVAKGVDAREMRSLALHSYRHFALKRMLAALGSA